jgi:hypothetical protein
VNISKKMAILLALALGGAGLALADTRTGLVLHYSFDGDAGSVATDLSGQGNSGSFVGAGLEPDGVGGAAAAFDGIDDHVRVPSSASLMPAEVTIAAWVRFDSPPSEVKALVFKRNPNFSNNEAYALQRNAAGGLRFVLANEAQTRLDSEGTMSAGEWHHVAATFSQPVMSVYVDGQLAGTASHDSALAHNSTADVFIGAADHKYYPMGSFAHGAMDDVRIYDRALAAEEIAELAGVEPAETSGPVLHYTFDADFGNVVLDDSGNGRTGTVNGATWVPDGAQGGAYRFDDNSQVITATDAGLPSGDAPRTIALWMKIDTTYADGCTGMLGYGTQGYDSRFSGLGFDWRLDRNRIYFSPGGTCFLTEQQLPPPGTWMHVAYTYGGNGSHHLYYNGVLSDGMSELSGPVNTTLAGLLRLGGHPDNPGPDGGYLDDVRIYDRPLSAREIAELAGGRPPEEAPANDLVLHYAFNADDGATATDGSGFGNHGLIVGAGLEPDGGGGLAAAFDGIDDHVRVPSSASLMPAEVTIAAWVRFDSPPSEVKALVFKRNPNFSNNEAYALQLNAAGGLRFVLGNGTQTRLDSAGTMSAGEWHHVAATFSQPVMSVYVDGQLAGTASHNSALAHDAAANLFIGAADHAYYPMGSFARGAMDDVRIYGRALAADEIAELAGVEPAGTTGPVLHYTFDVNHGDIVLDDSGNGRTGTVNGATWVPDGARGGAYRFDDNARTILASDAGLPSGNAPRTMAAWMKLDAFPADGTTGMFTYGTLSWNQMSGLGFDWRLGRNQFYFSQNGGVYLSAARLEVPGEWRHVAYTYDGAGGHRFYVDGAPSDGISELWQPLNTVLSGQLLLGGHPGSVGPVGGYLDDVRIYDRPLSAREIAELAVVDSGEEDTPVGGDLVLHYSFNADDGIAATDLSEYGNHGQFAGAGLAPDGLGGQTATFDGVDDYLRVPSSASLMPTEVTIAGWVRFDSLPTEVAALVFKRNPNHANNEAFALQINLQGGLRFVLGNGGQTRLDSPAMVVGTWHHVAATFAQPAMRIYVDGVLAGTANHNYPLSHNAAADLLIGAADHSQHPENSFAHGALDDVKIFRRALSAAEIAVLSGAASGDEDPPATGGNMILHYPFDVDDGATTADAGEYGNHGTVQGMQIVPEGGLGPAASFDGQDDYVRVPWNASLKAADLTIATWVKLETLPSGVQSLVFKRVPGIANGMDYALQLTPEGGVRWTLAKHWQTVLDTPPLAIGRWHHVVATFSKPDMRLYLDGLLVGTASHFDNLTKNAATDLLIGAADRPTGEVCDFAHCQLDDLRLYNIVLSESQIAELAGSAGEGDLVLRYTFDADGPETVMDSSGYGNNGAFVGAQIADNGLVGNGAAFDGTDDYVRASSSESLMPEAVTISAWVRFDSLPAEVADLVFKRNMDLDNNESYALQIQSGGGVRFVLGNGAQTRLDSAPMGVGEWHHVVATFARPDMKIYVDGALAGTAVHDYPLAHNPASDLLIGVRDHAELPLSSFAHGMLDDVRIYRRALGAQEVAALVEQQIAAGVLDQQDADGDGRSNAMERRAGTDALNRGDLLEIKELVRNAESSGIVVLRWASVPGQTYRVLWSSDLTAGFVPLASGILATGTECAYTSELGAGRSSYYVIQVQE